MSNSIVDNERAYLIAQLGLTQAQGAAMSLADLRSAFYSNPPSGYPDFANGASALLLPGMIKQGGASTLLSTYTALLPIFIPKKMRFTSGQIRVTTGVAASTVTMGFFKFPAAGGAVVDPAVGTVGPFDTSTTSSSPTAACDITLDKGLYFMGALANAAGVGCQCASLAMLNPVWFPNNFNRTDINGFRINSTNAFATGGTVSTEAGQVPVLAISGVTYP